MSTPPSSSTKRLLESLLTFVTVVGSVTVAMQQAASEWKFAGVATILATALTYRWIWIQLHRKRERSIVASLGHQEQLYHYTGVQRHLLKGGIVAITCLLCVGALVFLDVAAAAPAKSNKLVILVADFDGPDQDFGVTEAILEELRKLEISDSLVEVRSTGKIRPKDGSRKARQVGADSSASVVIWGWYRKTDSRVRLTIHYETMDNPCWLKQGTVTKTEIGKPEDLACFEMQTKLSSDLHTLALITSGVTHYNAKRYQRAREYLEGAISDPHRINGVIDDKAVAKLLHYRAYARWQTGDRQLALNDFDSSLRRVRDNWDAFGGRGEIYAQLGDFRRAIANYDTAVQLSGGDPQAYIRRGKISQMAGDTSRSLADLNLGLRKNPTDGWGHIYRGDAYLSMNRSDLAVAEYTRALADSSCDACAYMKRGTVYYNRYVADPARNRIAIDQAIEDFNQSVKHDSTCYATYYNRALAYKVKGHTRLAYLDLTKAIDLNPNDYSARVERGWMLLYKLNLPEVALADINVALAVDSSDAERFIDRGRARAAIRQAQRARVDFERAVTLAKDPSVREAAMGELRQLRS